MAPRRHLLRGEALSARSLIVRIFKGARRLDVLDGGRAVFSCPIALGATPQGDKQVEGDGRTPEGELFVCTRNARSRYHLFLGLSYPSPEDAERGLRDRIVTPREALAIARAAALGHRPPWSTQLGGEIGIHGDGGEPRQGDWTRGCVAVTDEAMDELWQLCPLGTRVFIEP